MNTNVAPLGLLSFFFLRLSTILLAQGSLTPPGAPAPTMKTLNQVEPRTPIDAMHTPGDSDSLFKITQPGSYYLTGNITGVAGKHGIEIAASGVTLDLGGFDLLGVAGSLDGVSVTTAAIQSNIAVVNGSVRGWGDEGIDLATSAPVNCRIDGVLAAFNAGSGISTGTDSTVTNCSAYQNTGNGINTGTGGTVSNCSAAYNGGEGINIGPGCTASNCSAYHNTFDGITTNSICAVSNCSAYSNSRNGISTGIGCTVLNCSATGNTGIGISTGSSCALSDCSAYQNNDVGIEAGSKSTVTECTADNNVLDGIKCTGDCTIRGNVCSTNGNSGDGAGIHATNNNNRIEGNNCTGADRGIDVDLSGNIIIKNTCSGNTIDWVIAANNVFGPIIDRRAPASAAVSGFSAASTLGSTDSNANFSY